MSTDFAPETLAVTTPFGLSDWQWAQHRCAEEGMDGLWADLVKWLLALQMHPRSIDTLISVTKLESRRRAAEAGLAELYRLDDRRSFRR